MVTVVIDYLDSKGNINTIEEDVDSYIVNSSCGEINTVIYLLQTKHLDIGQVIEFEVIDEFDEIPEEMYYNED